MTEVIREAQAQFFDANPPLYPWPGLLRRHGLERLFKPREAFWALAWRKLAPPVGSRVLDLGCGTGIWLDRLGQAFGIRGVGLDVSRSSLATANVSGKGRHRYLCADASRLPLRKGAFGTVFSLDALEHVADQQAFLREMARVLAPGGRILVWSINRSQRFTWNWVLMKLGVDVFDRVAHEPALIPDPPAVVDQLRQAGLSVESPDYFNSFFTLVLDEIIMLAVDLLRRLGAFERRSAFRDAVGEAFLWGCHCLTAWLWRPLHWLDRPWCARGLSNGFLVLASKAPMQVADTLDTTGRWLTEEPAGALQPLAISNSFRSAVPGGL